MGQRSISLYLARGKDWGVSTSSALMLAKSFLLSLPQYILCSYYPLMSAMGKRKVQTIINAALRIVVCAPVSARLEALWRETNMLSLRELSHLRTIQAYFRARNYNKVFNPVGFFETRTKLLPGRLGVNPDAFADVIATVKQEMHNCHYHVNNAFYLDCAIDSQSEAISACERHQVNAAIYTDGSYKGNF